MRQYALSVQSGAVMIILGKNIHITSFRVISFGFLFVILAGSFLLMMPFASKAPGSASFIDSLFTATSAVCVTGLVVHDTATYWTSFGHAVILCLIQIGGMGVITVAVALAMISGRKIGLMQRNTMKEAIAAPHVGGIVRLTKFIVKITIFIELTGALIMSPVFIRDFGIGRGIWFSFFHSISAFCNAGFDLLGIRGPYSSLTSYVTQPVINLVIMGLIIAGGFGFLTWEDVLLHGIHFRKYRLQSKMILTITPFLIILPALFFYFYEYNNVQGPARFWLSIFQSVTPRTAGFNTADLASLSEPSVAIITILMLIGGSPGSTAGGMKNTTVFFLILSSLSVFRRKNDTVCFKRRISDDTLKNASTILMMYLVLFLTGGLMISCLEKLPIHVCLFETASAIGTVGLTLGITPTLGSVSKLILICLMFFGRVGGLTLIFATSANPRHNLSRFPQEDVTVG